LDPAAPTTIATDEQDSRSTPQPGNGASATGCRPLMPRCEALPGPESAMTMLAAIGRMPQVPVRRSCPIDAVIDHMAIAPSASRRSSKS